MDEHVLTIKTVRDGPVCTLILDGDLDYSETGGFLAQAALAVDDRTERLVLDLAGVTFLDCAGVRALTMAANFAPGGCPVIIRSLSPRARRIFELLEVDLENLRHAGSGPGTHKTDPGLVISQQEPGSAGAGPFPRPQGMTRTGGGGSLFEMVSGVPVVTAPEEIDITNAPQLRSALLSAAAHGHGTLVADMTRTRFCDSSGLQTLLAAHNRAQSEGGQLLLVIPATAVLRVFAITGMNRVIPNFTSLDQALAHTSGARPARA